MGALYWGNGSQLGGCAVETGVQQLRSVERAAPATLQLENPAGV